MKTTDKRTCPVCNTLFVGSSDVCPVCVLKSALEPKNHATVTELRFEYYQILKNDDASLMELGHGAMGVTYKAIDVNLRCEVALKVINARFIGDESARCRFVREARAAASVCHPNIASVFHLGRTGENYFYATEFVEGETLESLIRRSGRLETKLALEIATQVASGLAKSFDEPGDQTAISTPGAFAGTPEFASPEQFAGVGVDIRLDLYSLGVTLWEMVIGQTHSEVLPVR